MGNNHKLKILFASVEVAPYAKTGGLADVAGSLPKSLSMEGHDIRVVMPRYKNIECSMDYITDFPVTIRHRQETCIVRESEIKFRKSGKVGSVPVYFIDNYHFYHRDGIYCHSDDADRFAFFCNAVLDMLPKIDFKPDIIHCNDWHTGPICMLLDEKYKAYPFYKEISTLFTIHNLEYQGNFSKDVLPLFDIGNEIFVPEKVEFYGTFSFMKTGLVYSDVINTVSRTYAKEIQTPQYGEKLEGLLKSRKADLFGIVNGISCDDFNPEIDPMIYKHYSARNPEGKSENKKGLQKEIEPPQRDVPLIGLISRLTGQKGLGLILDEIDNILKQDIQFVLLGQGEEYYETSFKELERKYPDKIAVFTEFNTVLAQKIYAGSDIFLMPSRFEPCGLGQLLSLRYGTIPVVRATGGLADTVFDVDKDSVNGNGFVFTEFSSQEFLKALQRAIRFYTTQPVEWKELVKKALSLDFSWDQSALEYMTLYQKLVKKKQSNLTR